MKRLFTLIFIGFFSYSNAQDIDGKWTGSFIQYIHNTYDVQMTLKKLPPGDIFSARLQITDGYYFGEYQISGNICGKHNLEITAIFLMRESAPQSWIDCLNGTWDLNDDENELTFTDTWLTGGEKPSPCKVKYIQKDMFQCLRSSYLRKEKYHDLVAEFEKKWSEYDHSTQLSKLPVAQKSNLSPKITKTVAAAKTDITKSTKTAKSAKTGNPDVADNNIADISISPPGIIPAAQVVAANEEPALVKELKSETKIVAKNEDRAPVIDTFERVKMRPVYAKDEIEVSSPDLIIEYWDRYTEDGDSINLYLNKVPILQNALLTKAKKILNVHLEKVKNYLVLDAINMGTEPPNTASITVKDGKKIQNVSLTSTMKTSGALKIILKK